MTKIRAVFWDIDGTMVTSEPVHKAKMDHVANLHGLELKEDIHTKFHGVGDYRAFELLQELGLPGSQEQFMDACNAYYETQLHDVNPREGFVEAFLLLDQKGIVQGAVSNGTEPLVRMNIVRSTVGDKLKVIIDLDYVESSGLKPKPFPDPYLEALRKVNEGSPDQIHPSECLVVEDSPTGIQAGKAAGMNAIYWKLSLEKACPAADFEAYTGQDLMDILLREYL